MPDERRYTPAEIETIFQIAAREPSTSESGPAPDGLTLPELQTIGEEVGLPAERVAEAAAWLDRRRPVRRLTTAGAPVGIQMSFDLPRAPTDREWAMLVAELRQTFGAEGRTRSLGGQWEWRNGNLYAAIEPTKEGYQLRMGTRKGQAPALALGSLLVFVMALDGFQDGAAAGPIFLLLVGLLLLAPLLRLRRWANLREAQMDRIGQWTTELIGAAPASGPAPPAGDGGPT
jgi:hypothetical protein